MTTKQLFLTATKMKLRVETNSGYLTVEDLWDLPLKSLDAIGIEIRDRIGESGASGSLLENPDAGDTAARKEDELRLDIIKEIIRVKQEENKEKRDANAKAKRREFLLGLQKKKELDQLENLSAEEIAAELAALDAPDAAE